MYPCTREIFASGRFGEVLVTDELTIECVECQELYKISFRYLTGRSNPVEWKCRICLGYAEEYIDIFPEDVSLMQWWDKSTLGERGQLTTKSIVSAYCVRCGEWFTKVWSHFNEGHCGSCSSELSWDENRKREHADRMRLRWATPEHRTKLLDNSPHSCLTGPHARLKAAIEECGIHGFESEEIVWIDGCPKYRPDEIDFERGLIIEVFGDYWHANPNSYQRNDLISYPKGVRKYAWEIWQEDEERLGALENEGYRIFVAWEHDINKNLNSVISDIIEWINQQSISSTPANVALTT
jgi:G:T-mismatch repair DNA endonuclease (very short patch repair protein)